MAEDSRSSADAAGAGGSYAELVGTHGSTFVDPAEDIKSDGGPVANISIIDNDHTVDPHDILTAVSPKRWAVLFIYLTLAASNQWLWITFSTITDLTEEKFGVASSAVDWLSTVYFIVYIPFVFLGPLMVTSYSLRTAVVISSCFNCAGAIVRYIACLSDSYAVLMLGQIIAAFAQPFFYPLSTQLASEWFPVSERAFATGVGVLSNYLGTALGLLVGVLFINEESAYNEYFFFEAVMCAVIFLIALLLFSATPAIPPSITAPQVRVPVDSRKPPAFSKDSFKVLWKQSKSLMKKRSFALLFIAFGINVGAFDAVCTLAASITDWEDSTVTAFIYFTFVMGGVVGSLIFGVLVSQLQRFKRIASVGFFLCAGALLGFGFVSSFDDDDLWIVYVIAAICGFFFIGNITTGLEFGAELAYPLQEYAPSTLLLLSEQIFAIILIEPFSLTDYGGAGILYIFAAAELLGLILLLLTKEELGRVEVESGHARAFTEVPSHLIRSPDPSPSAERKAVKKYSLEEDTERSVAIAHLKIDNL